jgi:lipoprotein-releasing system permease protein
MAKTASHSSTPFGGWERSLALRYLKARREDGGVAMISIISFVGIMLAVGALIIVMSVMNGFRADLLDRILGVNGHMYVDVRDIPQSEAEAIRLKLLGVAGVESVREQVTGQVMAVGTGTAVRGAQVTGLTPEGLQSLPFMTDGIVSGSLESFGKGEYGGEDIAIGSRLASDLGVLPGDYVELVSPVGAATAFGSAPQSKEYRVGAVFNIGMSEYDAITIYMPLSQAQLFFGRDGQVDALEARLVQPDQSDRMFAPFYQIAPTRIITDWKQQSASLVGALKIERNVMRLILSLLITIAALNIISGLVMLVKNKGRDIAVLRTMGATRGSIMRIFVMIGASVGVLGTIAGVAVAVVFCLNIEAIQHGLEMVFGPLFDAQIYFLDAIPAKVEWDEVAFTGLFAMAMSILVTLPPSWRAANLDPVEALRYE